MDLPIPDVYRVAERFLAGAYPGARKPSVAARRLRAFEAYGITHFVDLAHPDDGLVPYESLLTTPVRRLARSIVDFGVVTPTRMTAILDELDEILGAEGSVYVHCWGGIGRTGIVSVAGCGVMAWTTATRSHALPCSEQTSATRTGGRPRPPRSESS